MIHQIGHRVILVEDFAQIELLQLNGYQVLRQRSRRNSCSSRPYCR